MCPSDYCTCWAPTKTSTPTIAHSENQKSGHSHNSTGTCMDDLEDNEKSNRERKTPMARLHVQVTLIFVRNWRPHDVLYHPFSHRTRRQTKVNFRHSFCAVSPVNTSLTSAHWVQAWCTPIPYWVYSACATGLASGSSVKLAQSSLFRVPKTHFATQTAGKPFSLNVMPP